MHPDQIDNAGDEANGCGGAFGALATDRSSCTAVGVVGVYCTEVLDASSSVGYLNYSTGSTHQPVNSNAPSYPTPVGFFGGNGNLGVQWARLRAAPPSGVMLVAATGTRAPGPSLPMPLPLLPQACLSETCVPPSP